MNIPTTDQVLEANEIIRKAYSITNRTSRRIFLREELLALIMDRDNHPAGIVM